MRRAKLLQNGKNIVVIVRHRHKIAIAAMDVAAGGVNEICSAISFALQPKCVRNVSANRVS